MRTQARTPTKRQPARRALRSSTGVFASFTDTPRQPLSDTELEDAKNLIHDAHKSNIALVEAGAELDNARERLRLAETDLAAVRADNSRIHTALAPLLARLPA